MVSAVLFISALLAAARGRNQIRARIINCSRFCASVEAMRRCAAPLAGGGEQSSQPKTSGSGFEIGLARVLSGFAGGVPGGIKRKRLVLRLEFTLSWKVHVSISGIFGHVLIIEMGSGEVGTGLRQAQDESRKGSG